MDLVMQLFGRLSAEDIQSQVIEPALRKRGVTACARDAVVAACAPFGVPVTGKIRTGWDSTTINATEVCRILCNSFE